MYIAASISLLLESLKELMGGDKFQYAKQTQHNYSNFLQKLEYLSVLLGL
jgi:hypothetical protein